MPAAPELRRQAALAEVTNALGAARCAARIAGMETGEFAVRELLLTVIQQIDRAAAVLRRGL